MSTYLRIWKIEYYSLMKNDLDDFCIKEKNESTTFEHFCNYTLFIHNILMHIKMTNFYIRLFIQEMEVIMR